MSTARRGRVKVRDLGLEGAQRDHAQQLALEVEELPVLVKVPAGEVVGEGDAQHRSKESAFTVSPRRLRRLHLRSRGGARCKPCLPRLSLLKAGHLNSMAFSGHCSTQAPQAIHFSGS